MSTRIDYGQLAAKTDYAALNKKLEQLGQREPPKKRKTASDVLEPLRERLLALHHKGWSSGQLVEELKAAGVPVSPARLRECLCRWTGNASGTAKPRSKRRQKGAMANGEPTEATSHAGRTKSTTGDGQPGLRLPEH
jgi:hypothetical protein